LSITVTNAKTGIVEETRSAASVVTTSPAPAAAKKLKA